MPENCSAVQPVTQALEPWRTMLLQRQGTFTITQSQKFA